MKALRSLVLCLQNSCEQGELFSYSCKSKKKKEIRTEFRFYFVSIETKFT